MYRMTMLLGLLVAIMSVSASGVGFIGAPTAGLEKGQWNVGFNYMYSNMGLERTTVTDAWAEYEDGDLVDRDVYNLDKINIDDVKTQRYYGTIGYGLSNSWEAYVQLGIADVKAKSRDSVYDPLDEPDAPWERPDWQWAGHNFDNDLAWGLGTKITFLEQGNWRWGASVQMNWVDTSHDVTKAGETDSEIDWIAKEEFDYSTYDLIIAVGPTVDMGGWSLYGGPFYYMLEGDLDIDAMAAWENGECGSSFIILLFAGRNTIAGRKCLGKN